MMRSANLAFINPGFERGKTKFSTLNGDLYRDTNAIGEATASVDVLPIVGNDNGTEIRATAQALKAMLSSYSMHLSSDLREGLLRQTSAIADPTIWDEEDEIASVDSYRTMLRAVVAIQPRSRPNLALSDRGNFLGAWRSLDHDSDFAVIEFFPMDRMRWSINAKSGEFVNRAVGMTSITEIEKIFDAHGATELIRG